MRQAINYAVNKDAVVQALGGQLGGLKATTYTHPGIEDVRNTTCTLQRRTRPSS